MDSCQEDPVRKIPWRKDRLPTPAFLGLPGGSDRKVSACKEGDLGLIPGSEDALEEGTATHSSILAWRTPVDRGAWWATVHGVARSQTGLNDCAQQNTGRYQVSVSSSHECLLGPRHCAEHLTGLTFPVVIRVLRSGHPLLSPFYK